MRAEGDDTDRQSGVGEGVGVHLGAVRKAAEGCFGDSSLCADTSLDEQYGGEQESLDKLHESPRG